MEFCIPINARRRCTSERALFDQATKVLLDRCHQCTVAIIDDDRCLVVVGEATSSQVGGADDYSVTSRLAHCVDLGMEGFFR
ncbi:hypothetical protein D3C76_1031640 [compost metagenome]